MRTEEVGFHWVALSAQDKPVETRGLHEIKAIWENSTKHVQTESIYNETEARAAVEMAALIVGGKDKLRERPVLSVMQCTAPPLGHDGGSLDAALVAAEYGLPTGFMTMSSCLTTGPATLAGTLAVGNAEVIAGTALLQLAYPGAPVFYAAAQTASDPRTGVYTGGGPGRFPVRRGHQCAIRFLRHPAFDGIVRHRRKRTQLAGGHRERALHLHGQHRHVRYAAGAGLPARQPHLVVCRDDDGLRDLLDHPQDHAGHRGGRRDTWRWKRLPTSVLAATS